MFIFSSFGGDQTIVKRVSGRKDWILEKAGPVYLKRANLISACNGLRIPPITDPIEPIAIKASEHRPINGRAGFRFHLEVERLEARPVV